MDLRAVIMEEVLLEDLDDNEGAMGLAVLGLAEPLVNNVAEENPAVPRNSNFFEETIPQYMGDLFVNHFRMTRTCFEVRCVLKQQIGLSQ